MTFLENISTLLLFTSYLWHRKGVTAWMPYEWEKKILHGALDENYNSHKWWHFFKSEAWMFQAVLTGTLLNVGFYALWTMLHMTLEWQNIFVITAYAFFAYLPNGYNIIREEGIVLLMNTYYWVLLLGIPVGAHFMFWGFFWTFALLIILLLCAALNAGLWVKFERWQEDNKETRGKR